MYKIKKITSVSNWAIRSFFIFTAFLSTATLGLSVAQAGQPKFVIIGTGGVTGVYYPAGGAICRMINKKRKEHGIRCSVESTQGSVANLNTMGNGELDLAVAQSDSQYHAYNGSDVFRPLGANKNLRSVFALHAEPFTVVARADAGIKVFDDLLGKRVNIGNPGSGQRETMEILMAAKGWDKKNFRLVSELSSVEQASALCDNKIDAFVFSVGHPAGSLKEAANSCDVVIVRVDGAVVDQLIAENSFYKAAVVPGGTYRGNPDDVPTFGVSASIMASATTDKEMIYIVVKSVFENLETLKKMHPAFKQLDRDKMAKNSPDVPIHDGAMRYYDEVGLSQ